MGSDQDILVHAMAADNQVRCMAAVTTSLVGEACRRHGTFPTASVALGRTLTGGLLLGRMVKDLEKITVHFNCDGPIGNIIAQSDARGNVRGYVSNPDADVTRMNSDGKFDVKSVVGGGTMYVTRDAGFEIGLLKEPYHGSVPIVSGEIAEDFAFYLAQSEQVNSAVSIGVLMTVEKPAAPGPAKLSPEFPIEQLRVAAAGGYMIQMMPSADEALIDHIERTVSVAPNSTEMIREGVRAIEMLEWTVGNLGLTVLEEIEPRFFCQCSRQRALFIISALGHNEIKDMLTKDRGAELRCHFCNEVYRISEEELALMLTETED